MAVTQTFLEDALVFCRDVVEAGAEIGANERQFGEEVVTKLKDGTPQTPTDVKIDRFIGEAIRINRPPNEIYVGEESAKDATAWIADPWDGTWLRRVGARMGVTSLALVIGGKPLVGVVRNPFTRETFYAIDGGPAYLNDGIIQTSGAQSLHKAAFCLPGWTETLDSGVLFTELVVKNKGDILNSGSAIYDLLQVAMGVACVTVYPYWSSWDGAAVHVIGKGAGATISGLHGGPLWFGGAIDGMLVAASPQAHAQALVAVRKSLRPVR